MSKVFITLVMVATLFVSGCGTTPKKVAYKTLKAVGVAVDKGADALALAYVKGKVTDAELDHAKNVLHDYNVMYVAACESAANNVETDAPADVLRMADEFLILVTAFSK